MAQEAVQIDMTPMIDVTFNLLIFFLCTLNFATSEGMLDAYLPKDVGVFNVLTKKSPEEPVYIKLVQKSKEEPAVIWVGGSSFRGDEKFTQLYTKLKQIVAKATEEKAAAIIDPDITTCFQEVISTLDVCRKVRDETKRLEIKFSAKALAESSQ